MRWIGPARVRLGRFRSRADNVDLFGGLVHVCRAPVLGAIRRYFSAVYLMTTHRDGHESSKSRGGSVEGGGARDGRQTAARLIPIVSLILATLQEGVNKTVDSPSTMRKPWGTACYLMLVSPNLSVKLLGAA